MRIAALGRTHWLYESILAVLSEGHEVVFIATAPEAPEYRVTARDFEELANRIGCPSINATNLNRDDLVSQMKATGADVAISVNWPTVIGKAGREAFRHGIVNAHAGDLPRFRGNACPNWAILSGEDKVVLTLHQMGAGIDDGPILFKTPFPLTPMTYIGDVYNFLTNEIPNAYKLVLAGLETGAIVPVVQASDASESLRCFPRLPIDGEIDWQAPAEAIARLVRATAEPFAGAYTYFEGKKLIVWRAYPEELGYPSLGIPGQVVGTDRASGAVSVLTGSGVLVIERVESENRKAEPASIIRSTRSRLGGQWPARLMELERRLRMLEIKLESNISDRQP